MVCWLLKPPGPPLPVVLLCSQFSARPAAALLAAQQEIKRF
jgi:hypothetical protein